ncbi:hypothetical protein SAMN05216198_3862 [Halopseudomonas litoralis]|uniref:Uncharacterized protein n=1 Tax=Halopseudomonas litoralis TaxID=797277 RepID=A0A1H1Y5R4_9GAMM|nr:hypothetical protein [Halopseudomonas litoralis]SDT16751.1 hypothetical protein SAMN05216198_3862 [Halopseudomonas litoralis]
MLFKEKLLLSNCDSVRALDGDELRKRFLTGLAFADGVVLSPNALIDNLDIAPVIGQTNVVTYLNEEGSGKLVIRGFGMAQHSNLEEYYHALPGSFILSSLPGAPRKDALDRYQQQRMRDRIAALQKVLHEVRPVTEDLSLVRESLRNEVFTRLADPACAQHYFESDGDYNLFLLGADKAISRSEWYSHTQNFFGSRGMGTFPRFRAEIIDPAYNSLFAIPNEGFLQDDIRYLTGVPEVILDASIGFKSMRREIELIQYPLKVFEFISSFGAGEIVRFLTEEAIGYIEDKMVDGGKTYMTRKNWFGMYPRMRRFMGLEIK